jgi:hypothetical protein
MARLSESIKRGRKRKFPPSGEVPAPLTSVIESASILEAAPAPLAAPLHPGMRFLDHPQHGTHIAYCAAEVELCQRNGWTLRQG